MPSCWFRLRRYFNSRPSARGDRHSQHHSERRSHFNSRPSARGDLRSGGTLARQSAISIHAPPRGATCTRRSCGFPPIFQFTPLREGRPLRLASLAFYAFQFTPLREGRQTKGSQEMEQFIISIHAPPRGATSATCVPRVLRISIHAPPRGATNRQNRNITPCGNFNSRPSARGD